MLWYQVKGNDSDTVISSRVRFARNLADYRFDEKLSEQDTAKVIDLVAEALGEDFTRVDLCDLSPTMAQSLVEQHLVSREFAQRKAPHALFRNEGKSVYVMTPEEDHIRLQCILPGLALSDAYRFACEYDDRLDDALTLAFDERLGYLTHCPTNLGTGMRASVMLFLPALTKGGYIPSLAHELSKIGLTVRGLYGEGSGSKGCIYQISNQVTLGYTEQDILRKLEDFVKSIIQKERDLRKAQQNANSERLSDRIHRAEGTLRYAGLLSSEEFFALYTDLKLGIALGEITSITDEVLNTLLFNILPATLCLSAPALPKSELERDALRASFIKKALEVKEK